MEDKKIMYFSAPWCWKCKLQSPVIDKLISDWLEIEKIDCGSDEWMKIAEKYSLMSLPAIIILNKTTCEFKTLNGLIPEEEVLRYAK